MKKFTGEISAMRKEDRENLRQVYFDAEKGGQKEDYGEKAFMNLKFILIFILCCTSSLSFAQAQKLAHNIK
jgi:hypothetical protein